MLKIIIGNLGYGLSVFMLVGCTMSTPKQNMGSSKTIKIIRETPSQNTRVRQVMVSTGQIENVDYNSSIISPEREGYIPDATKHTTQKKSTITDNVGNKVSSNVSSRVSQVKSKANSVVDTTVDTALDKLFR